MFNEKQVLKYVTFLADKNKSFHELSITEYLKKTMKEINQKSPDKIENVKRVLTEKKSSISRYLKTNARIHNFRS